MKKFALYVSLCAAWSSCFAASVTVSVSNLPTLDAGSSTVFTKKAKQVPSTDSYSTFAFSTNTNGSVKFSAVRHTGVGSANPGERVVLTEATTAGVAKASGDMETYANVVGVSCDVDEQMAFPTYSMSADITGCDTAYYCTIGHFVGGCDLSNYVQNTELGNVSSGMSAWDGNLNCYRFMIWDLGFNDYILVGDATVTCDFR